ncbi:hypothetical protein ACFWB2_32035 [Streptomyces virginiae]|uniref:hypothetical protein n=1 Tax=Streptomyces virginiae TaxID=1961 RepID=UPI003684397A
MMSHIARWRRRGVRVTRTGYTLALLAPLPGDEPQVAPAPSGPVHTAAPDLAEQIISMALRMRGVSL